VLEDVIKDKGVRGGTAKVRISEREAFRWTMNYICRIEVKEAEEEV
jgi:hypothetical protein